MFARRGWFAIAIAAAAIAAAALLTARNGSPAAPESRLGVAQYAARYRMKDALARSNRSSIRLVLIGDSITGMYDQPVSLAGEDRTYLDVWKHYYGDRDAIDFGFTGDTTSNVLARIRAGEVDGLHPAVVVLLAGTNNVQRFHHLVFWSAQADVQGIGEVVKELHSHLPGARILLLSVPPCGPDPSTLLRRLTGGWRAGRTARINQGLAREFGGGAVPYVTYRDMTESFYKGGRLDPSLFVDGVHLTVKGQAAMAAAIEPSISDLLGDKSKEPMHVGVASSAGGLNRSSD